jgi:ferric-dicitrate binding protein FerR (iron transport regulator)
MSAPRRGVNEDARALARLCEIVRGLTTGEVPEPRRTWARGRFLGELARRRRPLGAPFVALGGVGALAAGGAARLQREQRAFAAVEWAGGTQSHYVGAGPGEGATMRFEDGSFVEFGPRSRGRVGASGAMPVRIVLEAGHASVHGKARSSRGFLLEAGPYVLRTSDATFDVAWSGSAFEVHVGSGALTLEGDVARHGLTLRKDQSFATCEAAGDARCF